MKINYVTNLGYYCYLIVYYTNRRCWQFCLFDSKNYLFFVNDFIFDSASAAEEKGISWGTDILIQKYQKK